MKVQEPLKNIFHINFDTQHELAATFLRFQEHYESPEFRGEVFSLDQFKEWYILHSPKGRETGEFTYYDDWSGFNIPSEILTPFFRGDFDPLSERERELLTHFHRRNGDLFYIIGTHGEKETSTLHHEIAHGLFYTSQEYKAIVLAILDNIPKTERDKIKY